MAALLTDWVIVFDLDDTLYKEADYVHSGIAAVASLLKHLYHTDLYDVLVTAHHNGIRDLWQYACELLDLPISVKESLLWVYRLHSPSIELDESVRCFIEGLISMGTVLAIVTDGRAVTQRLKLIALGLAEVPVFISEEYESQKPDPKRFSEICIRWPGKQYVYIADNPAKDFLAPNAMGWFTVGLRGDERNVHSQQHDDRPESAPQMWVEHLWEIEKVLSS